MKQSYCQFFRALYIVDGRSSLQKDSCHQGHMKQRVTSARETWLSKGVGTDPASKHTQGPKP